MFILYSGKIGSQIIIPYRGDQTYIERLRLTGDLGQVLFFVSILQDLYLGHIICPIVIKPFNSSLVHFNEATICVYLFHDY